MTKRLTFKEALAQSKSLTMPAAHDAMSARLIEQAGFSGVAISGSAMLAARYGLPDMGVVGLADMIAASRDVIGATSLPCLGDGDDGYGGAKSVARTVRENEALGVGAIVIEDQARNAKQPGQQAARGIVDDAEIASKLRVASESRDSKDFWIIGRTDSYATDGMDATLRRAEMYLQNGADGIFCAGMKTEADLIKVGETFKGVPMVAVIYGGDGWPSMSISDLTDLGYTFIVYPLNLILPVCLAMGNALEELKQAIDSGGVPAPVPDEKRAREILNRAVNMDYWTGIE